MPETIGSPLPVGGFIAAVFALPAPDIAVLHPRPHAVTTRAPGPTGRPVEALRVRKGR